MFSDLPSLYYMAVDCPAYGPKENVDKRNILYSLVVNGFSTTWSKFLLNNW